MIQVKTRIGSEAIRLVPVFGDLELTRAVERGILAEVTSNNADSSAEIDSKSDVATFVMESNDTKYDIRGVIRVCGRVGVSEALSRKLRSLSLEKDKVRDLDSEFFSRFNFGDVFRLGIWQHKFGRPAETSMVRFTVGSIDTRFDVSGMNRLQILQQRRVHATDIDKHRYRRMRRFGSMVSDLFDMCE